MKPALLRGFASMLLAVLPFYLLWGQDCRFQETKILRHNDSLVVELGVFGAVRNDLADPLQGVCEVRLSFLHNAILDFEVSLVSPAGQEVRLIGPNGSISSLTLGGQWNIGFVPCATTAQPDPPFQAKWDNQVNFFPSSRYKGTYYPFSGCLEDFDRGPVNGTWKLKLKTFPTATRVNNRLDNFEIRFCDELGRNCCFAKAGQISGAKVLKGCQGDNSLILKPRAQGQQTDSLEYGYTWLLGKDQILLERGQQFDLRTMPVGEYEVCGLSYDWLSTPALPDPNGSIRLDTLRAALYRITPPFCGKIMDTCMKVTVLPPPDTGNFVQVICEGDSYQIGGKTFQDPGIYFVPLVSAAGCDSILRLDLRVQLSKRTSLNETICEGNAYRVGSTSYTLAGSYSDTLTAANGCDSIVQLTLSLYALPQKFDTVRICPGTGYVAGGKLFSKAGDYQVRLPAGGALCDTLLNLTIVVLNPRIVLGGARELTCAQPSLILDASASQPAGSLRFRWEGAGGVILGNQPFLEVNRPGRYVLQVVQEAGSAICAAQFALVVTENFTRPDARIAGLDTLSCKNSELTISGINDNPASDAAIQWVSPGLFAPASDSTPQFRVTAPGDYALVLADRRSGCSDTAQIAVVLDTVKPIALAGADTVLNCTSPSALLVAGDPGPPGISYSFLWQDLAGMALSRERSVLVSQPGTYFVEVTNDQNGCKSADVAQVGGDFQRPQISVRAPNFACGQDSILAQAILQPVTSPYRLEWSGSGVVESKGQLRQMVYRPGLLTLKVENLRNGCTAEESIFIGQSPCPPCITAPAQDTLTCSVKEVQIKATLCRPCGSCTFTWVAESGGLIVRNGNTLNPVVARGGRFRVIARDSIGLETAFTVVVPTDTIPPRVNAGSDKTLTCSRKVVELGLRDSSQVGAFEYSWTDKSGMLLPSGQQPLAQAFLPGQYIFAVQSLANGCVGRDSVEVLLDTIRPKAIAGPGVLLTCAMPRASLDGSRSASGFSMRYFWESFGGGRILAGNQSIAPLVDAAGGYKLTVTDTLNGCTASDSVQVSAIFAGPTLGTIPDQTLNCRDTLVRLEAKLPDARQYAYCWKSLEPTPDTLCQRELSIGVRRPGRWVFELTDMATGCSSSQTVRVKADTAAPFFDAGLADTLRCNRPLLALSGKTSLQAGTYTISWSGNGGRIISGQNTLMPEVAAPAVYTGRLQSLLNYCFSTDSVRVRSDTIRPLSSAGQDTFLTCRNRTLRLMGAAGGASLSLGWSWTTSDGQILDDAGSLSPLIAKKGKYVFTVTDRKNGCSRPDTIEVGEKILPPVLALASPGPYILTCKLDTLVLDGNSSRSPFGGRLQLSWQAFGGGEFGQIQPGRIVVRKPGRFRLVTRDLDTGCSDSLEVQVAADFVHPLVDFRSVPPITCKEKTVLLEAAIGGTGIRHAYQWQLPGGGQVETDTAALPISIPGQYTLTVINENTGCATTQKIDIESDTEPPIIFSGSMDALDCDTREVRLDAGNSRGRILSFQWRALEGAFDGPANGSAIRVSASGRIELVLTDGVNGCLARDTFLVEEKGNYIDSVEFTLVPPGCGRGGSLSVSAVEGGTAPFRYKLDNRISDPAGNFVNIPPGTYRFLVSDSEGCTWSTTVEMAPPRLISVELGPDRDIYSGDSSILHAIVSPPQDGIVYQWTGISPSVLDTKSPMQTVQPLKTTTYHVLAKAPNGCTASDQLTLYVRSDLPVFLPTAFSPNGDGQNDVFFVQAGKRVREVSSFRIFNRWGTLLFEQVIFQPNDPALGWDGRHRGEPMSAGVYIFHAVVQMHDGREVQLQGSFTLMR